MHNKKSWEDMHLIEETLGRQIIRVDTSDVDVMEEVRADFFMRHLPKVLMIKNAF